MKRGLVITIIFLAGQREVTEEQTWFLGKIEMRIMGAGVFLDKILRRMFLSRKKILQNGYNYNTVDWETGTRERGTPPPLSFAPVLSGRPPPHTHLFPFSPCLVLNPSQEFSCLGLWSCWAPHLMESSLWAIHPRHWGPATSNARPVVSSVCFCLSLFLQSYTSLWGLLVFWDMTSPCSVSSFNASLLMLSFIIALFVFVVHRTVSCTITSGLERFSLWSAILQKVVKF